jgi:hypothetical protein
MSIALVIKEYVVFWIILILIAITADAWIVGAKKTPAMVFGVIAAAERCVNQPNKGVKPSSSPGTSALRPGVNYDPRRGDTLVLISLWWSRARER